MRNAILLREEMDRQVEVFLKQLRENGYVINTVIVIATTERIIQNHGSSLLASNGGPVLIINKY